MTTGETQTSMAYKGIVDNLMALRNKAQDDNHGEITPINSILASVMSLQLVDRFSRIPIAGAGNSMQPVPPGATDRASKKASPWSIRTSPKVLPLAELLRTKLGQWEGGVTCIYPRLKWKGEGRFRRCLTCPHGWHHLQS
jgi:hypothetical protein